MAVHSRVIKTKYCRYTFVCMVIYSTSPNKCCIRTWRDEIKSHVARPIVRYQLEMISALMQYHLQSMTVHEKQVWLCETRRNNAKNMAKS